MAHNSDYELLDSGGSEKLERFGDKRLVRPSSLGIWQRAQAHSFWEQADARFIPGEGWKFTGSPFEQWEMTAAPGLRLRLRLQRNGQIGFFPEHAQYLNQLVRAIEACREAAPPRVLNLFAYTGLATVCCVRAGAEVTHVDISKPALQWANENLALNGEAGKVRMIAEDALRFLAREARRGARYQVVIADPPNFSRQARGKSWELDDVIVQLVRSVLEVLDRKQGVFFVSSHLPYGGRELISNLVQDFLPAGEGPRVEARDLLLTERGARRALPAGSMIIGRIAPAE